MNGLAVYALTAPGAALGLKVKRGLAALRPTALFLPRRLANMVPADEAGLTVYDHLGAALAGNFTSYSGHVVIGATGLVVRLIAPLLKSKTVDPAVVTLGQDGRFVISLLSGHLGGANELAGLVALVTGGQAVVNTATDLEGRPALEMLARELDLAVEDFSRLPAVSRLLVEGARLPVYDPEGFLRPRLRPWPGVFEFLTEAPVDDIGPMVWVDWRAGDEPAGALVLRPRVLALGLGCHRGLAPAALADFVKETLVRRQVALAAVAVLATVETRASEPAFLELARNLGRPLSIFTKEELGAVETPNPSNVVFKEIGVSSVCEAAALLAARTDRLLITKQKGDKATLAAARISLT